MKKFFERHETLVCILLIVLYVVLNSFCMQNFGTGDYRSTVINMLFSAALIGLVLALGGRRYYGLTRAAEPRKYGYFLPLLPIISVNLWGGIHLNHTAAETIFYILTMLNIGFIEEIIFRGFLFRMMAKSNLRSAVIVSALTFGVGHIVNLLNGAELIPTLLQIAYAVSIGFLFVVLFHKSGSLIPCIVTHSLVNALSVFNAEDSALRYVTAAFLIVYPLIWLGFLCRGQQKTT